MLPDAAQAWSVVGVGRLRARYESVQINGRIHLLVLCQGIGQGVDLEDLDEQGLDVLDVQVQGDGGTRRELG
ncbi:MAG: hypothetical protein CL434_14205 [Acidimicrobiaceae bacterium]|nr:hypothetical protein [Acidimicrobiaceae bacterium]